MIWILLLSCSSLLAWDSEADGKTGAEAARQPWTAEHRDFQAAALGAFGITGPSEPTLRVFTDGSMFSSDLESVRPASSWAGVQAVQSRAYTLGGFADLPDLSFSVAGWLAGNEICPVEGATQSHCYGVLGSGLASWLAGGLNSSHFLPQAGSAFHWYHQLAIDTADRCAEMDRALSELSLGETGTSNLILEQCEVEALMYEGTAGHYLHDAWSSGHMWQRWGSAEPADWLALSGSESEAFARSMAVGAVSGMIHGFKILLYDTPLCAPNDKVRCVPGSGGAPELCVGDGHADDLEEDFPEQNDRLWACVFGSVDEVVGRLPGALGGVTAGFTMPGDTACFDQRVTNGAVRESFFFDHIGAASTIMFVARLIVDWEEVLDKILLELESLGSIETEMRIDIVTAAILLDASFWSTANPDDATNLANGLYNMEDGSTVEMTAMGMRPNGAYVGSYSSEAGVSTYDPPVEVVTGARAGTEAQEERAEVLRRGLPRSHADSWCAMDLAAEVESVASGCRDTLRADTARDASCEACGLLGSWLRLEGTGPEEPGEYDAVCDAFDEGAGRRLYLPGSVAPELSSSSSGYTSELAQAWCGHGCATRVSVAELDAADAAVDYDETLSTYLTQIEAKIIGTRAYADYWLSAGQYSLWEYYSVVATNFGYDLIAIAELLASARYKENAISRWQGGAELDDYYGPLADTVGMNEHAVVARPSVPSWDGVLVDLPTQTIVFALESDEDYPFLFTASGKTLVDDDTGEVTLRLKNLLFIVTPYLQEAQLVLSLDGSRVVTLDNISMETGEVDLPLGTEGVHRLTFDVEGLGLDVDDLFSDDYDTEMEFRILAMDFIVESPFDGEACGMR